MSDRRMEDFFIASITDSGAVAYPATRAYECSALAFVLGQVSALNIASTISGDAVSLSRARACESAQSAALALWGDVPLLAGDIDSIYCEFC